MATRLHLPTWRKTVIRAMVRFLYGIPRRWRPRPRSAVSSDPQRILLLNAAHIGDVIVASSMLPVLRAAYPSAEIGFVTGSWARMVVAGNPDIAYIHCVDHWWANRSSDSFPQKVRRYLGTRRAALWKIRKLKYDVALCAYGHFPDMLDLAAACEIPVRIGFTDSLFASLATHLVELPKNPLIHQSARLAELLRALPIAPELFALRRSMLPPSSQAVVAETADLLQGLGVRGPYRVVHMGSGDIVREFPYAFWREFAEMMFARHTLVFTGRGEREEQNILSVIRGIPNCINACNRLGWEHYVAAVRQAEVVYGVESMAGHVAAAVGTKCIVVYGGAAGVARWRPHGEESIVFTNHVPCAPCYRPLGCPGMACKNVRVQDVVGLGY